MRESDGNWFPNCFLKRYAFKYLIMQLWAVFPRQGLWGWGSMNHFLHIQMKVMPVWVRFPPCLIWTIHMLQVNKQLELLIISLIRVWDFLSKDISSTKTGTVGHWPTDTGSTMACSMPDSESQEE